MPVHALLLAFVLAADPTYAAPPEEAGAAPDPLRALAAAAASDPPIAAVREAAGREATKELPPPGAWARRTRLAALLPRLSAEWRSDEQSYRTVGLQTSGEVDYLRLAPGRSFAVGATWELGAVVAAREELAASAAAVARARRREEAVGRATALYYERRRAVVALVVAPPASALARAEAALAIERLTAELDALTGGLFARGARP
jgi:hypothetical protein